MKKITFLLFALPFCAFAQQTDNFYQESMNGNVSVISTSSEAVITRNSESQPITSTYTDLTEFQDDFSNDCSGSTITSEDFSGGTTGITECGPTINDQGDGACFPGGEIESGFEITSTGTGSNNTILITAGEIGNTNVLVGANSFADNTVITFTTTTLAVGMTVFNNSDVDTDFSVFDASGTLIESFTLTNAAGSENFFGVISDEAIGSIVVEGANDSGELIGNLEFGDCVLGLSDTSLASQLSVFPIPSRDIVNIESNSRTINSVTLYDILGKNTGVTYDNGTINISTLPTGIYYAKIQSGDQSYTQKIIRE